MRASLDIRVIGREGLGAAGELLVDAFGRGARGRGFAPPWATAKDAADVVAESMATGPAGVLGAWDGGRLVGVGVVRRRGEVATIGPLAAAEGGQGIGGAVLDALVAQADEWGCGSIRLYADAWNPDAVALYLGRSFAVTDVVVRIERPPQAPPKTDGSRGLEIAPFRPTDRAELVALDTKLTGHERASDLAAHTRLVARRRGALVGYLAAREAALGPAVALDVADLFALVARAVADPALRGAPTGRLSTSSPTASLAALGLGFRVAETGLVMVRGVAPPARPPQLYSLAPEVV